MTAPDFTLERNPFGRLVLTLADGTRHEGVTLVRAFPVSAPQEGLSLVATDGHEALWVDHLQHLSAPLRSLIEQELAGREFVPQLQRLLAVSSFSTPCTWEVETDRGPTRFVLKSEEDIRRLQGRRKLMIASEEGLHFLVPDVLALDKHSRKLLERFL